MAEEVHAEETGDDHADHSARRNYRQALHVVGGTTSAVGIEILVDVARLLAHVVVELVAAELLRPALVDVGGEDLVGDLAEPVAVVEAQEQLERLAHALLELPHAVVVAHAQALDRDREAVREVEERALVEVDQHADLEELVPEGLRQVAAGIAVLGDHGERRPAYHVARVHAARRVFGVPEAVVTVTVLEIGEESAREGKRLRRAPLGREADARDVAAGERARLVEREEAHDGDALVLDLVVLELPPAEVRRHQGLEQALPMQRQRRLLDLAHQRDVLLAGAVVGRGDDPPLRVEELHLVGAVRRLPGLLPRGGIRASEAVHRLHRVGERQVARHDLESEQRDVHVIEEDEPQPRDLEFHRRRACPQGDPRARDVVAPEDVQARGRPGVGLAEAVQEALHVGKEVDELAVAELARVVVDEQVVLHRLPRTRVRAQHLPWMRKTARAAQPAQLQRPQQHVAELADGLVFRGGHGEAFLRVASAPVLPQKQNRGQTPSIPRGDSGSPRRRRAPGSRYPRPARDTRRAWPDRPPPP